MCVYAFNFVFTTHCFQLEHRRKWFYFRVIFALFMLVYVSYIMDINMYSELYNRSVQFNDAFSVASSSSSYASSSTLFLCFLHLPSKKQQEANIKNMGNPQRQFHRNSVASKFSSSVNEKYSWLYQKSIKRKPSERKKGDTDDDDDDDDGVNLKNFFIFIHHWYLQCQF